MPATVRFRLHDGTEVEVTEGGLIGRAATAQLRLEGVGVSEAHALVTRRGHELRIQALRGKVRVNDTPVAEGALRAGQRLLLGAATPLLVVDVRVAPEDGDPMAITVGSPPRPVQVTVGAGVVRLQEGEDPPLQLGGNQAELLRLLAEATEPQHWSQIARYFWPERDQPRWRERFDAMIMEVRAKLRDHRIRGDLLWSWDGSYSLKLNPEDVVTRD